LHIYAELSINPTKIKEHTGKKALISNPHLKLTSTKHANFFFTTHPTLTRYHTVMSFPTLYEITRKTYPEQAKWFLNAFWRSGGEQNAENVWVFAQEFIKLDAEKKKNGNELDEFWSHKYVPFYNFIYLFEEHQ
jgi:hypothetical protein